MNIRRVLRYGMLALVGAGLLGARSCYIITEQEPNDTADQALAQTFDIGSDIAIAEGVTGYKDQTLCCPDIDYWRFTGIGSTIKIVVHKPDSDGCYDIDFGRYSTTAVDHFEPAWYDQAAGIPWSDHTCNIVPGFVSPDRTYTFDASYNMMRVRPGASYRFDVSFE